MASVIDSIRLASSLKNSDQEFFHFGDRNQISMRERIPLNLDQNEDEVSLWDHFKTVDFCVEFLDTTQLTLETEPANKLSIDDSRQRRNTNIHSKHSKKKRQRSALFKKKDEMRELYIGSRPAELNKKNIHQNIFFNPRSGTKPVEQEKKPDENTEIIKAGVELFNQKPAKGITHWKENNLISDEGSDIAKFLFNCTGLDKVKLGEFLSEEDSLEILGSFVQLIDFKHVDFDLALRKFLFCFKMPGEAQKVDRCMRKFASHYYSYDTDNSLFEHELAVYVLAFSTIMLNTDAHNVQVRNKMTEKQFVENTQYNKGGENIPAEFLTDLYGRIQNEEIMLDPEKSCFPNASMKGWLFLHAKNNKWKRKWVVLSDNCLYICKKPAEITALLGVSLKDCTVEQYDNPDKTRKFCLCIYLPKSATPTATSPSAAPESEAKAHILLSPSSAEDLEKWKSGITAAII